MKRIAELLLALLPLLLFSCSKDNRPPVPGEKEFSDVMILYLCGQNDLKGNIQRNISQLQDIESGAFIPDGGSDKAIVVCEHIAEDYTYSKSAPVYIYWIYRHNGEIRIDTLSKQTPVTLADAATMREMLGFIRNKFKSEHYGLVFSGHGTGWMPQGSYTTEDRSEPWDFLGSDTDDAVWEPEMKRSFGQERVNGKDYFIDVTEFEEALPFRPDYMIFDSCLMGCVETAYELRNLTDVIGLSQAEVMGSGFNYHTMAMNLLLKHNPQGVMEDTFKYYSDSKSTSVVSCIRTSGLEKLAENCGALIERYRNELDGIDHKKVQGFFTDNHHWFYDLEDIFVQCGIPDSELTGLREALGECVTYSAFTPKILSAYPVRTNCGLSMYLPAYGGSTKLEDYYRTLAWNKAVHLVD